MGRGVGIERDAGRVVPQLRRRLRPPDLLQRMLDIVEIERRPDHDLAVVLVVLLPLDPLVVPEFLRGIPLPVIVHGHRDVDDALLQPLASQSWKASVLLRRVSHVSHRRGPSPQAMTEEETLISGLIAMAPR